MRIQYVKHPDAPHWRHEPMRVLGEDAHGLWLGADKSTWLQKGERPEPQTVHERGFFAVNPFVQLVVPDAWWTMIFNGDHRDMTHYVDVVTPAERSADEVRFTDLDLDVIRHKDGSVMVDDEDEFELHRRRLDYPPLWVDKARATAAEVVLALESQQEPFGEVCRKWRKTLLNGA